MLILANISVIKCCNVIQVDFVNASLGLKNSFSPSPQLSKNKDIFLKYVNVRQNKKDFYVRKIFGFAAHFSMKMLLLTRFLNRVKIVFKSYLIMFRMNR